MRNIIGNNLTLTLFGESHNQEIGVVLDGLGAGIKIDEDYISLCLSRRRPNPMIETSRKESDHYRFISGIFNSYTTGSSLGIIVENENIKSSDYDDMSHLARPGHADYTSFVKYHGYNDYRGGGHFSGRLTTPIVIAGAIVKKALEKFDIKIASHIKQIGNVNDRDFEDFDKDINLVKDQFFPVLNQVQKQMEDEISKARNESDSIGGKIQVAITNLPVGLGEPYFSSLESEISKAMFSLGGVKGIEFGLGFGFCSSRGSKVNDSFVYSDGKVITKTNNNGGINGGISNGMLVVFSLAIKPTPSISKPQETIDFKNKTNEVINIKGRHDPCIVRRICVVSEALTALVIGDLLITKYGNDVFTKEKLD